MPDDLDQPTSHILERKLATILSADVAEFSRLMGEDEEETLRTFRGHKEAFESLVSMHRGRVFNTAGDAILAEFGSAVEAVRCATDIQAAIRTRNHHFPLARQVRFRIGINLGDVMLQDQDLLGDGVNVAARLQTAAEPGGICISASVHDQIRNKLSLSFQSMGDMSFKNILQPVRTFSITEVEGSGALPTPKSSGAGSGSAKWIGARLPWISRSYRVLRLWGLSTALAIAAVWGWLRPQSQVSATPNFTLTIVPPKGTNLPSVGSVRGVPQLSPDGTYVVTNDLLRSLNSIRMESLRSMDGVTGEAFWSADSKWLAFPVADQLRKVHIPDGAPEVIAQLPGVNRGGAWNHDGTILVATAEAEVWGLYMLQAGRTLTRVLVPGLREGVFYYPEFVPGRQDFIFAFRPDGAANTEIYLATLRNGTAINPVRLMQNPTAAHYTPAGGGRILFVRNDNLYSQSLSLKGRRLEGDPELVQQGVASAPGRALAEFSVSRSGLVAWRPGTQALSQVTVFDRQGRRTGAFGPPNDFRYLRLSPDETHVLASAEDSGSQLLEPDQPGMFGLGPIGWWVWSSDGSHLLGREGSRIVERSVIGSGEVRTLAEAPLINFLEDVSPDGQLALYSSNKGGERALFSVRLDGSQGNRSTPVVQTGEQILNARFSPDGRWIVYDARTVQGETVGTFVQPFPGPGLRRQVSSTGLYPIWRKDGKEIIYVDYASGKISSIPVRGTREELRFGAPTPLFTLPSTVNGTIGRNPMAVTSDGSRILFPRSLPQPEDSNVIQVKSGW